jgi:hypothetical protein
MEYEKIKTVRNPSLKTSQQFVPAKPKDDKGFEFKKPLNLPEVNHQMQQDNNMDFARKKAQRQEIQKNSIVERLAVVTAQTSSAIN